MSRPILFAMPVSASEHLTGRLLRSVAFRLRHYAGLAEERLMELRLRQGGGQAARSIPTWTSKAELRALYHLAAGVPVAGCIVEIGSYLGASTCYLGAGSAGNDARITCIDTWKNETMPEGQRDTFAEFQRNTSGFRDRLIIVRKTSAEVLPEDLPASIHLAFIDADHSYEATKADAALIMPRVAAAGIIAFHDTCTFAGVSRVLGEILAGNEWCLAGHVENLTWIRPAALSQWPLPVAGT